MPKPIARVVRAKSHRSDAGAEARLVAIEELIAELRYYPGQFSSAAAWAQHGGLTAEQLEPLLREHYHATPEDLIRRARIAAARELLLTGNEALAKIARAVGYSSAGIFENDFSALNGLLPAAYRALRSEPGFSLRLPKDYPLAYLRRALSRDGQSVTEKLEGEVYRTGIQVGEETNLLTLTFSPNRVVVSLAAPSAQWPRLHRLVVGLLGLDQDASAFTQLIESQGLAHFVAGRPGLRISQTHTVYTGLLWAIVGQQINLRFASLLLRRLVEKVGTPVTHGLYAPPTPGAVASLEPGDLLPLQYSRQKADYVISISRLIANGQLDLEALGEMSATRAARTLLAIRGLGPWSVNYLLMRSLGFADCLPLGDTGVTSGLQALFQLEKRPDAADTLRLMAPFSPFRSLVTAHLWQFNQPPPS